MYHYEISDTKNLSKKIEPDSSWGKHFGSHSGFTIRFNKRYFMSVYVDDRLGTPEGFMLIDRAEIVIARCISCVGEIWEVRAEPTGPGKAGIVIYTSKGKAVIAGELVQSEDEVVCEYETLYAGMTNKWKFEVKGETKIVTKADGKKEWQTTASASVSKER